MESAIPAHLQRTRTRDPRVGVYPQSVAPAVVPRFDESVSTITVAYLGLQHRLEDDPRDAAKARDWLIGALRSDEDACRFEESRFVDRAGYVNGLFACYWVGERFGLWWARVGARWTRDDAWLPGIGRYAEVFRPTVDRIEAITDGIVLRGLTSLAGRTSGPVREQGYWGAMRDRIALSQTDALMPDGRFRAVPDGTLVQVQVPSNLCVIRTGQDWSQGEPAERLDYRERIEPTMKASMDLLDGSGAEFGCLCNRYAWIVGDSGALTDATFGLSIWRSLAHLERWAEGHYAHLTSYVRSVQHGERHGTSARLSRYHEVLVPVTEHMQLEYRRCHGKTGVLEAAVS